MHVCIKIVHRHINVKSCRDIGVKENLLLQARYEVVDEILQDDQVPAISRLADNQVFQRTLKTTLDFKGMVLCVHLLMIIKR